MCTGVRFSDEEGNMYFGRNLDWCESYGEGVVITPRGASIPTQFLGSLSPEHACVGMGIVVGFVARVGFDGFGRLFSRGVADFAAGALAVGFARGILIVLEGGNILHTMADITRQTTCIIFQIGNGLSNILVPTSGTFMVALTMAKVPYGKWAKWFIPLLGLQFAAGAVLVLIANAIRLGPM